jgi:hypothetical protein
MSPDGYKLPGNGYPPKRKPPEGGFLVNHDLRESDGSG